MPRILPIYGNVQWFFECFEIPLTKGAMSNNPMKRKKNDPPTPKRIRGNGLRPSPSKLTPAASQLVNTIGQRLNIENEKVKLKFDVNAGGYSDFYGRVSNLKSSNIFCILCVLNEFNSGGLRKVFLYKKEDPRNLRSHIDHVHKNIINDFATLSSSKSH